MKFDDPYWQQYSQEKRIVKCDWCKKDVDLKDAEFVPVGLSRHRVMCQECNDNTKVVECSWKHPTDEQLGIIDDPEPTEKKESQNDLLNWMLKHRGEKSADEVMEDYYGSGSGAGL